jgi:hypothetical protein
MMVKTVPAFLFLMCVGLHTAWAQTPPPAQSAPRGQTTAAATAPRRGAPVAAAATAAATAPRRGAPPAIGAAAAATAPRRGAPPAAGATAAQPPRRVPATTPAPRPTSRGTSTPETLVRPIENLSADDVADTLRAFLTELDTASRARDNVVIVSEMATNTLLISAPPASMEEIVRLIDQLDRERPSIRVELLIAEVLPQSESASPASGMSMMMGGARRQPGFGSTMGGMMGGRGRAGGIPNMQIPTGTANTVEQEIRALQSSGRLSILGTPQITVLENKPAYLQVGQNLPVSRAMPDEEDPEPSIVDYEEVGLLVGITARVNSRGRVSMNVNIENSLLVPTSPGNTAAPGVLQLPRSAHMALETTVTLADGESAILGGLTGNSAPPSSRLLIIATPHIIAPPE